MRKLLLCAFAAGLCGQSAVAQTVSSPVAGIVWNGQGRLVTVRGVLGNLMPGKPLALPAEMNDRAVLGAAFCGAIGAILIEGEVLVVDASGAVQLRMAAPGDAPGGGVLFAFDPQGTSLRWIYIAESKTLQQVGGGALDATAWGDAVIALGAADGGASLAVLTRSGAQLWSESVSTATGAILSRAPVSGAAPGVFFEGGWLVKAEGGLAWQAESGAEPARRIALPEPAQTLQMAGLHAAAVNGQWLVNGNWQLVEIPLSPARRLLRRRTVAEPRP